MSKSNKPTKTVRLGVKGLNVSPVDEDTEGHGYRLGTTPAKGPQLGAKGPQLGAKMGLTAKGDDDTEGHGVRMVSSAKGPQLGAKGPQLGAKGRGLTASGDDDTEGHGSRFTTKR